MIILGVDLGHKRTGLSVCDITETMARPLTVLIEKDMDKLCFQVARVAITLRAGVSVVGLPKNMDGSEGESAKFAREMGAKIGEQSGVPVEFVDERGTTITANHLLNETNTRGRKRKAVVDGVAATIILEDYLARRRNLAEAEARAAEEAAAEAAENAEENTEEAIAEVAEENIEQAGGVQPT